MEVEKELPGQADGNWWAAWREGWQTQEMASVDRVLCEYAEKLTRTPGAMAEADVQGLRAQGLSDVAIHDAIQVIAYFNYINRIADAVHVDLEPDMDPYPG